MVDPAHLLTFVVASFLLGITPGPDIVYVLTRGTVQGPKAGLAASAGLMTGLMGHVILGAVGISALVAASPMAFSAIKIAGAAYLVWLGIKMWQADGVLSADGTVAAQSLPAIYRQSILMALLNPKLVIFFLAFLPQFIQAETERFALDFVFLGAIFIAVNFVVMGGAGVLSGQVQRFVMGQQDTVVWTHRLAGSVLILLGVMLVVGL